MHFDVILGQFQSMYNGNDMLEWHELRLIFEAVSFARIWMLLCQNSQDVKFKSSAKARISKAKEPKAEVQKSTVKRQHWNGWTLKNWIPCAT